MKILKLKISSAVVSVICVLFLNTANSNADEPVRHAKPKIDGRSVVGCYEDAFDNQEPTDTCGTRGEAGAADAWCHKIYNNHATACEVQDLSQEPSPDFSLWVDYHSATTKNTFVDSPRGHFETGTTYLTSATCGDNSPIPLNCTISSVKQLLK